VLVLIVAMCAAGGYLLVHHARLDRAADDAAASRPSAAAVSAAADRPRAAPAPTGAPVPSAAAVTRALAAGAHDAALGPRLLGTVLDPVTGATLYNSAATATAAPASTAKLLTAVAALTVHRSADRITTTVVAGAAPGQVVLVGAGDPTLSAAPAGVAAAYAGAARLTDLAAQLDKAGVRPTSVAVDDSLFAGPAVSPDWAAEDVPSEYASPITAVLADGGRDAPNDTIRSSEPDLAAGRELATMIGVPEADVARASAPTGARVLASVQSPPYEVLVGQMLQSSDNVIAECLARLVARAVNAPATFIGAADAVAEVLRGLGVPAGAGMKDGSGLAADDRLSPAALAATLRVIVSPGHPVLHEIVTALPVAAWSGTLADRFLTSSAGAAGAGVVRAKTGTLTSVSALAGLVHDSDGRLLVFAFVADEVAPGTGPTAAAEAALDRLAGILAGCGCR
jgi:D-alanyl-D-alanine carboxypeptidase/D-alanyl-D-alanine-endopeptidase (penicillin-binding protein 4)